MSFIQQSGLYIAGRFVPTAIGLGGVALYTRLLDPAAMGQYALLLSAAYLVGSLAYTWLRVAAFRMVAGSEDSKKPDLFVTILVLFAAVSLLIAPVMAGTLHLYRPELSVVTIGLSGAAVVAVAWNELNAALLQAQLSVRWWSVLALLRSVGSVGFSLLLIAFGWRADALMAGFVLGNCTTLLFARMWSPAVRGRFDYATCRRCLHFGWPQSVSAGLSYGGGYVQRSMIDALVGAASLGIFSVVQNFGSFALGGLMGSVSLAGMPLAYQAKDRSDRAALTAQLEAYASLIFAIAVPATVGLCVLAEPITHVMFGPKFWNGAAAILAVIATAELASSLRTYYFDQAFELAMQTRPQAYISAIGTMVLVGTCILVVRPYGALGAALSALLAGVVALGLSAWWGGRVLSMPIPARDWLKTAFASAVMGVALVVAPRPSNLLTLAVEIAGGCLVYLLVSTATRPNRFRSYMYQRFPSLER